jgi:thioredoxin reductase (NADPH)
MPTRPTAADPPLDCLVIGAGPAGLTAAIYLARYRRPLALLDAGDSRAALIPRTRNMPGFPNGISGRGLLGRLRRQAGRFGVSVQTATVDALARDGDDFVANCGGRSWRARRVILATGVEDHPAPVVRPRRATLSGVVRWCPVCDGFEARDRRIFVIGEPRHGAAHALFLRSYSRDVTLVLGGDAELAAGACAELAAADVRLVRRDVERVRQLAGGGGEVVYADGARDAFDVAYPMLGSTGRSLLATRLGARCTAAGDLEVDRHQQTSIEGLYAIGDVVEALNQISVAVAQAALAATAVHNGLPRNLR